VNGPIEIGTANRNQVEMSIHVIRIIGAADIQEITGREAIYTEAGVLQRQTRTRQKEEELQVSENVSIFGVVVGIGVLLDIVNAMSAPLAEQVLAIMTEREEREKKRERENRMRGIDRGPELQYEDRVRRRPREPSVGSEEGNRRDSKRSRRERTPHTPTHPSSKVPDVSRPEKIEEKAEESEEGEIAE